MPTRNPSKHMSADSKGVAAHQVTARASQLAVLVAATFAGPALFGCDDPPITCGIYAWDPVLMTCVCPSGTSLTDSGTCVFADGGSLLRIDSGPCATRSYYRDSDGDTFGDPASMTIACAAPYGYVDNADDCDDGCESCRPGGTESCDGALDEDCSGAADEGCACTARATRPCSDGSDVGGCAIGVQTCAGTWSDCTGAVGPTAELCNGIDDDCDSVLDGPTAALSCATPDGATSVGCNAGSCVVTECASSHGDCDRDFANGCEAPFGTVEHCASCEQSCGWACEEGACNDADSVSAGVMQNCAIRQTGDVVCWGTDEFVLLAEPERPIRVRPVVVPGLTAVTELATGLHVCARTADEVWCWGENRFGQIGDGTMTYRPDPVRVVGLSEPVAQIAGTTFFTCALLSTGAVRCWGQNTYGQLGDGTTTDRSSPVAVPGLADVRAIATGGSHACALTEPGQVWCWGSNSNGQLGDGSTGNRPSPVHVSSLSDVTAISLGTSHTCALLATGVVRCWGNNTSGALGDGTTVERNRPATVIGASDVTAIGAGSQHTCALLSDGTARCWGANSQGQLGDGTTTTRTAPALVPALSDIVQISAGWQHTCARLSTGSVQCWGDNRVGQLGDGTMTDSTVPVSVAAP
jgi:alpha-tubulin suppressor-like RCC1 family protein